MRIVSFYGQGPKMLLLLVFLMGSLLTAQTDPKVKRDGKFKPKKNKVADHHQRTEQKKKHHSVDWTQHSKAENQSFSKKKKKKK